MLGSGAKPVAERCDLRTSRSMFEELLFRQGSSPNAAMRFLVHQARSVRKTAHVSGRIQPIQAITDFFITI